jgi:hypothetical protein
MLTDEFHVQAATELDLDYAFYCKGQVRITDKYETVDKLGDKEGYQHLFDIKKVNNEKDVTIAFELTDKTVYVTVAGSKASKIFVVNSYVDNFNDTRYGLLVRRNGKSATYKVTYKCVLKTVK